VPLAAARWSLLALLAARSGGAASTGSRCSPSATTVLGVAYVGVPLAYGYALRYFE
jgi:hypothetical protein